MKPANLLQGEFIAKGDDSVDIVAAGREAWQNIQDADKGKRYYWAKVGAALLEGRKYCESDACTIEGRAVSNRFGTWCNENGFGDMHSDYRGRAIRMAVILDTRSCAKLNLLDEITSPDPSHWLSAYRKQYPDQYAELFPPRKKAVAAPKAQRVVSDGQEPIVSSGDVGDAVIDRAHKRLSFKKTQERIRGSAVAMKTDTTEFEDTVAEMLDRMFGSVSDLLADEVRAAALMEAASIVRNAAYDIADQKSKEINNVE